MRRPAPDQRADPPPDEGDPDPAIVEDELRLPISDEGIFEAGADELQAEMGTRRREIEVREAEIRERLLDIEASLATIGASGLPFAARDPNRFQSALDRGRLRAEQDELRQELNALATERRILR